MVVGSLSVAWFPVGLVAGAAVGLAATLAMDVPMGRLPEGSTAPRVAAGTLTGRPLDRAPDGVATVVHYAAGVGSGALFLGVALTADWLLGTVTVAVPVAAVVLYALMNWFFSFVVVPTYGRVPDSRVGPVRRDWALSAAVYLVVASVLVAGAIAVAPA